MGTRFDLIEVGEDMNRLSKEKSSYLLQHTDNPVDWYPWGDEAFKHASEKGMPIFLSIGYSTCHWCHVMERESFSDKDVAKVLNEQFVCIKVDREERPDIDKVYMEVCQALTGQGGWPLTIIMTPDKKPFFAATYIPKESKYGMSGIIDLVNQIGKLWRTRRKDILDSADKLLASLREESRKMNVRTPAPLDEATKICFEELLVRYDQDHGGFSEAPKFPVPHNLRFLLRYWKHSGKPLALKMVEKTLSEMRLGGVFDQIGHGFHRYSTDAKWLVPHFEKMLYDQALLAIAYLEAYQATQKEFYAATARDIFGYVLKDLRAENGAFYSSEDADSEGEEGKFYLWDYEELKELLDDDEFDFMVRAFDLSEDGNFIDQMTGKKDGRNILHLIKPLDDLASILGIGGDAMLAKIESIRQKLLVARDRRIRPARDEKILTDWNGLMIAALAYGGRVLNDRRLIDAARRAADFLLDKMINGNAGLYHRYADNNVSISGFLDDYAFFAWGLFELYESNFRHRYLEMALEITREMLGRFSDSTDGGLFFTASEGESMILRNKESYDGAIPSGNSVAAMNLFRMARLTGDPELEKEGWRIIKHFSSIVFSSPTAHTHMLIALDFTSGDSREIVIVGQSDSEDTISMLEIVNSMFMPDASIILIDGKSDQIKDRISFIRDMRSIDGKATAYVCKNRACKLPINDIELLKATLTV